MGDSPAWKLGRQTRSLASRRQEARGLWNDSAARHVEQRFLNPHEQSAGSMVDNLGRQEATLERSATQIAQVREQGTAAHEAGEAHLEVVEQVNHDLTTAWDYIQRALHLEETARAHEQRAMALAGQAGQACAGCAADGGYLGAAAPVEYRQSALGGLGLLPVASSDVAARTSENRIDLADDCHASVTNTRSYGGYLDVVMHGDAAGTQADISGRRIDFSLDDTANMIRESPAWHDRPVRLLSCSTGRESFAQNLADRVRQPVYAPSDILKVRFDGSTFIANDGQWRRFEPSAASMP